MTLAEKQRTKKLNLTKFNLNKTWNEHWIIDQLRYSMKVIIQDKLSESDILFDPQDLEHQVLFYLTTYNPSKITNSIIKKAVQQQYIIIRERLLNNSSKEELEYLFRGLKCAYSDLNINNRLTLTWDNGILYAISDELKIEIEFKKITNIKYIKLFTDVLHYIHQKRSRGDVFGFYFKGDKYPWAIETTESSIYSRNYKRDALLCHGIHPDHAIELTRYYTLPGSPKNSVSIIDKLVKKYYKRYEPDIEALFTTTMPSYFKSKSTTIAGGINKVLCIKKLTHHFISCKINNIKCWKYVSKRWLESNKYKGDIKSTSINFNLFPKIDVYMPIKKISLDPITCLLDDNTNIYFN